MQKEKTAKPAKRFSKFNLGKKIFITATVIWPIIHFLIFWVYINLDTITLSFQRFSMNKGKYVFVGWKNYEGLFELLFKGYPDKTLQNAVKNSLSLFVSSNMILLPISIVCGYVLYKRVFASAAFRVVFYLPSIISIVVLTMCFKFMFDPNIGLISPMLEKIGLGKLIPEYGWFKNEKTAWGMVITYSLWAGVGYNVLLLTGAFTRIPTDLIESAHLDGIGFWRELWSITLPLIGSTINTLIVVGTTAVLTQFLQPMMLTGEGQEGATSTIAYYITALVKNGTNGLPSAATIGVFFSVVAIPIILGFRKLLDKLLPAIEF